MQKIIPLVIVVILILTTLGCGSKPQSAFQSAVSSRLDPQIFGSGEEVIRCPLAVAHVVVKSHNGFAHGTGVLIGEGRLLTAAHVVNAGTTLEIIFGGRDGVPETRAIGTPGGFRVTYFPGRDVALISGFRLNANISPMRVADLPPNAGETVTLIGLVQPDAIRAREGKVTHVRLNENRYYVAVMAERGDSGGPVINSKGEIIALNESITQLEEVTETMSPWGNGMMWTRQTKVTPTTFTVDVTGIKEQVSR